MVLGLTLGLASGCSPKSQEDCGYVQNVYGERISWKRDVPVTMNIHQSVPTQFRDAIYSAAQKWNAAEGREIIRIGQVVGGPGEAQKDNINVIYMNSTWDQSRASEQARTSVYWVGNRIQEADIRINDQNFNFYWQGSTQTQGVNIEALVLHELGHLLGLKHKDEAASVMQTYLANNTDRVQVGSLDLASLKCEY